MILDGKIPSGPLPEKWDRRLADMKLVNPANKRKYRIIMVGTGLAGASAAASLGELGYNVDVFCFQDSPRRAHSIAAQGGINAAKNYQNDGDSVFRLFYDTVKGGDFRSREANVYRLAQISVNIIDQCVAQGVPFAREYCGLLGLRAVGGARGSRTLSHPGPGAHPRTGASRGWGAVRAAGPRHRRAPVTGLPGWSPGTGAAAPGGPPSRAPPIATPDDPLSCAPPGRTAGEVSWQTRYAPASPSRKRARTSSRPRRAARATRSGSQDSS